MSETNKCGKPAEPLIAGVTHFLCVLPKKHEGECHGGGTCFYHGEYVGIYGCPVCFPNGQSRVFTVQTSEELIRAFRAQARELAAMKETGCEHGHPRACAEVVMPDRDPNHPSDTLVGKVVCRWCESEKQLRERVENERVNREAAIANWMLALERAEKAEGERDRLVGENEKLKGLLKHEP